MSGTSQRPTQHPPPPTHAHAHGACGGAVRCRACRAQTVSELLLKLYPLRQPFLSRAVSEALSGLVSNRQAGHLEARHIADVVAVGWPRRDAAREAAACACAVLRGRP